MLELRLIELLIGHISTPSSTAPSSAKSTSPHHIRKAATTTTTQQPHVSPCNPLNSPWRSLSLPHWPHRRHARLEVPPNLFRKGAVARPIRRLSDAEVSPISAASRGSIVSASTRSRRSISVLSAFSTRKLTASAVPLFANPTIQNSRLRHSDVGGHARSPDVIFPCYSCVLLHFDLWASFLDSPVWLEGRP